MPYLDSQIPPEDHKPGCPKPKAYGTYRRVKDEKGRRTWALRVLECPSCGVLIKVPHKYITKKQNDSSIPALPKILSEKERLESTKDIELRRIRTKEVQPVISPKEKKFRANVKSLNRMYKNDEKYCPRLKGKIKWDPKLVERFLDVRPTFGEIIQVMNCPPLCRRSNRHANRYRGWIPHHDEFGYLEYDPELIEFEKLVIAESQERMEYMEKIIKKHLESNIQVYYTAQDEDKKERSKHRIRKSIS